MPVVRILVMAGIQIVLDDFLETGKKKSRFEEKPLYVNSLKRYFEKQGITDIKSLVIIGSFTQNGMAKQFTKVSDTIDKLKSDFNIEKEQIMLVPGASDINYNSLFNLVGDGKVNPDGITLDMALKDFRDFYSSYFNKDEYTVSKVISSSVTIPELNVILLGLNTLAGFSYKDKSCVGQIDVCKLDGELKDANLNKYTLAMAFGYHGFTGDNNSDHLNPANDIESILSDYNIHTFFNHISEIRSQKIIREDCNYHIGINDVGGVNPHIILLESDENREIFKLRYFKFIDQENGQDYWQEITDNPNVFDKIPIHSAIGLEGVVHASENETIPDIPLTVASEKVEGSCKEERDCYSFINNEEEYVINEYLASVIRRKKLYMSGHFHWSRKGRSLSFIKTDYFFENYDCLERIKILYKKLIEEHKLLVVPKDPEQVDENKKRKLLIGYAMPGVLVGTQLSMHYRVPFSYIPAFIKYHTEDENKIPDGDYKTITVVIDIVYKYYIVNWILDKILEKEKIRQSLVRLNVVALFLGIKGEFKKDELKINKERKKKNQELLDVKLYYINKFPLDECNYKNKDECPVYSKKIVPIHVLSSED